MYHDNDQHPPFDEYHQHQPVADRCAPLCDDQLPIFSRVGRGPKGDSVYATIDDGWLIVTDDEGNEQKCKIGSGELTCSILYNLEDTPQTFTMTFVYTEDGEVKWRTVTPAIPFYGEAGDADQTAHVQTVWVYDGNKETPSWTEKLVYPNDFVGTHPAQGTTWTSNLIVAPGPIEIGGQTVQPDIIVPNEDDIYAHLHADLGWPTTGENAVEYVGDGGTDTVKDLIEDMIGDAIDTALAPILQTLGDILNKIYLGGTRDSSTGVVTWPNTDKIAIGDLNIFAGTETPLDTTVMNAIRTRTLSDNDIKAV